VSSSKLSSSSSYSSAVSMSFLNDQFSNSMAFPTGLESLLKSGGIKELQNNFFDCFFGIAKDHNGLRRQLSDYIQTVVKRKNFV